MSTWTEPTDITAAIRKQWNNGRILRDLTLEISQSPLEEPDKSEGEGSNASCAGAERPPKETPPPAPSMSEQATPPPHPQGSGATDSLFPMRIKLKAPTTAQIPEQFSEVASWIARLRDASRTGLGYGYGLIEVERSLRGLGRNTLPTHAIIPSAADALKMLHKTADAKRSLTFSAAILASFPEADERLCPWLARRALSLLDYSDDSERIISVLAWFKAHPHSGLYLRQLDIPGVDSKYIEHHRDVIGKLLELVLPPDALMPDAKKFEERFGLLAKPAMVRYRLLDPDLPAGLLTDVQTPAAQLAKIELPAPIKRVFITENEINGLAFPPVCKAMVIFGLGFGLEILRIIEWLADLPIYYWSDLDTHGFAMLSQLRSFLPQAQSMLMDEQTLLGLRHLWETEPKQQTGDLPHLTPSEQHVYNLLRDNIHGTGVRLEQERIPYSMVVDSLTY